MYVSVLGVYLHGLRGHVVGEDDLFGDIKDEAVVVGDDFSLLDVSLGEKAVS